MSTSVQYVPMCTVTFALTIFPFDGRCALWNFNFLSFLQRIKHSREERKKRLRKDLAKLREEYHLRGWVVSIVGGTVSSAA